MTPRVRNEIRKAKWQSRVWRKVRQQKDGHWLWTGTRYSDKYGFYQYGITQCANVRTPVHRAIWGWLRGPMPDGMQLVNTCGNTLCVNPDHWDLTDHWTHARRRA